MADQVQHLLLGLEIQASLRESKSNGKYPTVYQVCIEGTAEQLRFLSRIGIAGEKKSLMPLMVAELEKITANPNADIIPKEAWKFIVQPVKEKVGISWREFSQSIDTAYCGTTLFKSGLSRERMKRVYASLEDSTILNLANSDVLWDKVVSIKQLGVEDVYDATVEGAHNFIANDFIAHNSIEQDADVVLFIYRDDVYYTKEEWERRNPDKPYPKGIANIIVAKHRNGPTGQINLRFVPQVAKFTTLEQGGKEIEQQALPWLSG